MNASAQPLTPRGAKPELIIDATLYPRLLALAEQARKQAPELADQLLEEIERADLRDAASMPADVVTIGTTVTFGVDGRTQTLKIVLPSDADVAQGRVSLLSPVGAALLGMSAGQQITWEMPDGRAKVLEVVDVVQSVA